MKKTICLMVLALLISLNKVNASGMRSTAHFYNNRGEEVYKVETNSGAYFNVSDKKKVLDNVDKDYKGERNLVGFFYYHSLGEVEPKFDSSDTINDTSLTNIPTYFLGSGDVYIYPKFDKYEVTFRPKVNLGALESACNYTREDTYKMKKIMYEKLGVAYDENDLEKWYEKKKLVSDKVIYQTDEWWELNGMVNVPSEGLKFSPNSKFIKVADTLKGGYTTRGAYIGTMFYDSIYECYYDVQRRVHMNVGIHILDENEKEIKRVDEKCRGINVHRGRFVWENSKSEETAFKDFCDYVALKHAVTPGVPLTYLRGVGVFEETASNGITYTKYHAGVNNKNVDLYFKADTRVEDLEIKLINVDSKQVVNSVIVKKGSSLDKLSTLALLEVGEYNDIVRCDENGNVIGEIFGVNVEKSDTWYYKEVGKEIVVNCLNDKEEVIGSISKRHFDTLSLEDLASIDTSSMPNFITWENVPVKLDYASTKEGVYEVRPVLKEKVRVSYLLDGVVIDEEEIDYGTRASGIKVALPKDYILESYTPSLEEVVTSDIEINVNYRKVSHEDVVLTIDLPDKKDNEYYSYEGDYSFKIEYDKALDRADIDYSKLRKPYILFGEREEQALESLFGKSYTSNEVILKLNERLFKVNFYGYKKMESRSGLKYYEIPKSYNFSSVNINGVLYEFKGYSKEIVKVTRDEDYYAVYQNSSTGDLIVIDPNKPSGFRPIDKEEVPNLDLGVLPEISEGLFPVLKEIKTSKGNGSVKVVLYFDGSISDYSVDKIYYNHNEEMILKQEKDKEGLFDKESNWISLEISGNYNENYRVDEFSLVDAKQVM